MKRWALQVALGVFLIGVAGSATAATPAPAPTTFDFGTFVYNKIDLKIPNDAAPNMYGYVIAQYQPPAGGGRPLSAKSNSLLDKIWNFFAPQSNGITISLDITLKASNGTSIPLNTVALSSFSYNGKTLSSVAQQDFSDWSPVTSSFALTGSESITVTPHILLNKSSSANQAAFDDINKASAVVVGPNFLVSKLTSSAITTALVPAMDMALAESSESVKSDDTFHLGFFDQSQEVDIVFVDNGLNLGTIHIQLQTRCSVFYPINASCTNKYASIANQINLDSISYWSGAGATLKGFVTSNAVPRPATEVTNPPSTATPAQASSAVTASTNQTCQSLVDALGTNYLGLTPNDEYVALFKEFSDTGDFNNATITGTTCYTNLLVQWTALGLSPPTNAYLHDIATNQVKMLAINFTDALSAPANLRRSQFTEISTQFVGGGEFVDVSGVEGGIILDSPFQSPQMPAQSLTAQLKTWQAVNACWVDETNRAGAPNTDYVAHGFMNGVSMVNSQPVVDNRTLYAEVHLENKFEANGAPLVKKIVLRAATTSDWFGDAALQSCQAGFQQPAAGAGTPFTPKPATTIPTTKPGAPPTAAGVPPALGGH